MTGIRLREALSIGIGGMVGGGIFAVLGVAVAQAGALAWVSFLVAGVVAVLTAYSFWRFGIAVPSAGGAVEYLNRAFGTNTFTGGVNWLLWIGYSLMTALYAFAFGAYGAALLPGSDALWSHVLATGVILAFTGLNVLGAGDVGRAEDVLVVVKLLILGLFLVAGVTSAHPSDALHGGASVLTVMSAGMLVFLAYEGFELIANAVGDMEDPGRTLPRALFGATAFVTVLYGAITFVAVAGVAPQAIVDAQEYALARAAEPALGQAGFVLIAVAAVLSTAGAINSTLYGTQRLTFVMACDRELPRFVETEFRGRHLVGIMVTAVVALLLVNLIPLEGLAILGSSVFLVVFGLVNAGAWRMRKTLGANAVVPLVAALACLGSLVAVLAYSSRKDPLGIAVLAGLVALAFVAEAVYRRIVRDTTPASRQ